MNGTIRRLVQGAAALLAIGPGLAAAEEWQPPHRLLTPAGEYLLLGAGLVDFTAPELRNRANVGGAVEVRLGVGSRSFLGIEAAYVGSFRGGAAREHDLVTHGAEGIVRLQYPHGAHGALVEPFAFAGLGFGRLEVRDAPAGEEDSDDFGVVPFGAGVMLGSGRLLFDARLTYRKAFREDLSVSGSRRARASFDQWGLSAAVGFEF